MTTASMTTESNPDLQHCRGTLYAESHWNSVVNWYSDLGLYYYSSLPSPDVESSRLGIMAEFDSDADIFDRTRGGPNSERGSKALEPLLR
jgi:hypothetical protein